ncbi:hypothetical protein [Streptomyces sp. IB2014 016-6]|uniref:hypothetical protein n=1 Tax=Streptomyces sp. IB2014 016-6 TaxID=2517818 RepID=UPI0011C91DCE|nr:hypothetical protein [Streptomyces sp. IB2014 016-6]TXL86394.1 hypothetical protein EW053_27845 [Streptomyces sp. IB2014 016-6]
MSLPGADELFRTTGGMALQASSPGDRRRTANGEPRVPAPAGESDQGADQSGAAQPAAPAPAQEHSATDADSSATSRSRAPEREQQRRPQAAQDGGSGSGAGTPTVGQQGGPQGGQRRRGGRGANRRPSGRERHDEKITVYVSAEELMDLEHARLVLRGEHGLAVDRGRIVREAVAVVLADLESRGDASILVRRLRGR